VPPFLAISRFSDVFGKFAVSAGDIQHHPPDLDRGSDPQVTRPAEQSTKVELAVNLKAAKALNLTTPPTLPARADGVIE
jgi:hypothetical protein